MLTSVRENILIGDQEVTAKDLLDNKVTMVLIVGGKPNLEGLDPSIVEYRLSLFTDRINKPHVKDIACHIPKYMTQNGEVIAVLSETGLVRAAFVVCRAICELENRSIYEVMVELKGLIPEFDIGKAYL